MTETYKDIILSTPECNVIELKEDDISYSQLIENFDSSKNNETYNTTIMTADIDTYMTELLYGVMDKIDILKTEVEESGFMNSFSYDDVYFLLSKCITLEVIPDIQSENESDVDEDDSIEI